MARVANRWMTDRERTRRICTRTPDELLERLRSANWSQLQRTARILGSGHSMRTPAGVLASQIPTYHAQPFCREPIFPRSSNSSLTTMRSRNFTLL
jgi:hypothetical protein